MNPEEPGLEFVPVWEGTYAEASVRLSWLEQAHIPVDLGDASLPGRATVMVPVEYTDDARHVMQMGPVDRLPTILIDSNAPWLRGWMVAIAVILVVAIVLTFVI